MSKRDLPTAARLAERQQLLITETASGLRVETKGHVGVVRLEACTLRVEPRLVNGQETLVALLDAVLGLDLVKRLQGTARFQAEGVDLFDLIALCLADAADAVLKTGVIADYVEEDDELPTVRGRIDIQAQVLRRHGRLDRVHCRFDERTRSIDANRWLVRALHTARRGVRSSMVVPYVKRVAAAWREVCEDFAGGDLCRPIELTRVSQHYAPALELAYLVEDCASIDDPFSAGAATGFAFLLSMPALFERFICHAYEQLLRGTDWRVQSQVSDRSILWDVEGHKPFGTVRPDVMLSRKEPSTRIPVDAKYKDYCAGKLSPADVYQASIYALALARGGEPRCGLAYPAQSGVSRQTVELRAPGARPARIHATGVSVSDLLRELSASDIGVQGQRLLEAVGLLMRSGQ